MTDSKQVSQHQEILERIARKVMVERGLEPDFPKEAVSQLNRILAPASLEVDNVKDLRHLLWCSIDNDDSLDLDQLTAATLLPDGSVKVFVAIADVDAIVKNYTAIDLHARFNTLSVYTAAIIFPMLPEKLSNNLTSLNKNEERLAVVVEMVIPDDGSLKSSAIYRAAVENHAKLCYNDVSAWLEETAPAPKELSAVKGLEESIKLQDKVAQKLRSHRYENGALDLETIEGRPVFEGSVLKDYRIEKGGRADQIIEDFMIAANGIAARFLAAKKFPSIRRIVRVPKNWERIVALAGEQNFTLPAKPDSKALEKFLIKAKMDDPVRFPDLSLSVIKLLGPGEYVVELPGETSTGHFGLAVKDYAHSTAPNRRYPDLITQRLIKAAIADQQPPYSKKELDDIAKNCTKQEDAAKKVERQVTKSAAALLLGSKIGEDFEAIVTGASEKGTWVRLLELPFEGMLSAGFEGLEVGERLTVRLLKTDVERGFIDFKKV
ncbi:MAG TPA: RNB domain-containing ribonuclease [bacterium]|nr:RNB domain-containing ribonuclease [bacterium]